MTSWQEFLERGEAASPSSSAEAGDEGALRRSAEALHRRWRNNAHAWKESAEQREARGETAEAAHNRGFAAALEVTANMLRDALEGKVWR